MKNHSLLLAIRKSEKYKDWRRKVCKTYDVSPDQKGVQVHHIKKITQILKDNKIISLKQAMGCAELWDLKNGLPLTKGEHHIIGCLERHKRVSTGFLQFIKCWIAENEGKAIELKKCFGRVTRTAHT